MNNILVTGGSGFIGSHLCEKLLTLGERVINLDNFNNFYDPQIKRNNVEKVLSHPLYELFEGDIRDNGVLAGIFNTYSIDVVVHLAALAGVRNSINNPNEYVDTDIRGTSNVLEFCKDCSVKKFVFGSSSSVYGTNPLPFREDDYLNCPQSPYAAAKRSGEIFVKTYNHLYKTPSVCLRFFTVYGPRQRPEMAIHRFTKLIDEGREIPVYGDGKSSRDYTYVDDIVDGIISSINLDCDFEIFNLGSSRPVELDYLIRLIEDNLGKKAVRSYLPKQPGDVESTYADTDKASRMLNFTPKVSIEDGIKQFVNWYKS